MRHGSKFVLVSRIFRDVIHQSFETGWGQRDSGEFHFCDPIHEEIRREEVSSREERDRFSRQKGRQDLDEGTRIGEWTCDGESVRGNDGENFGLPVNSVYYFPENLSKICIFSPIFVVKIVNPTFPRS